MRPRPKGACTQGASQMLPEGGASRPHGPTRHRSGPRLSAPGGADTAQDAPEAGRGPGPPSGGPPSRAGRVRPALAAVCGPAPGPRLWRCRFAAPSAFCALRVRPCAGASGPCARPLRRGPPGPRFAAPVRRTAPVLRFAPSSGAGPRGRPPGSPARPLVRRFAAPRALAGPAALGVGFRCAAGFLRCAPVALAPLRLPAALRVAPPGPPAPVRFAASGPVASAPGACAALRAACCASGPLRFAGRWPAARARLRALRCRRPGCCACLRAARVRGCAALPGALLLRWPGASPCLPPAPAAPPGLAGCVRLRLGAAAPPSGLPFWSVLLDPVRYFGLGP